MNPLENQNSIFPKGEPASADYFTGTAWVNILVPQDETGSYAIGNVVFEPGCRNNWHKHPAGQILLVTDGKGYYQEKGRPARLLTKGDVVVIPSHVEHWHGAATDSSLTHIVVTHNTPNGAVEWLARVTDQEYTSCQPASPTPGKVKLTEAAIKNHEELFPNRQSTLHQSVPYVGIAKVLDVIHATNEILQSRGTTLPVEAQSTTSPETRYEKGLAVQKEIFGEMIDKMYRESPEDQLHFHKYLSANCFGDYYTRNGLDIKTRELLTLSMLIAMGGTEPQIKGHIQGNVNVGNDKKTILSLMTELLPYVGYPRTLNAIECLNEVKPE